MSFKLIKTHNLYSITYERKNHNYIGIINEPSKYFTYSGYIDYITDHLSELKFENMCKV